MAYVVRRPRGRWEVRESFTTPAGPRARTLASFTALTPEVLDHASRASRRGLDPDALLRAARRAGAPIRRRPAEALAASLLRCVAHGGHLRPGLSRLVRDTVADSLPLPQSIDDSLVPWIGASLEERGAALVDLLGLVDRLPRPLRKRLTFPGLSPAKLHR